MSLENLLKKLEHDSFLAIEWFQNNYMKLNEDKCDLHQGRTKINCNIKNCKIYVT